MGYIDKISYGNQTYSLHDTETSNILSNVVKPVVNLYDYSARAIGKALKSSPTADGTTVDNPNYDTSGYIPVVPGVRYKYQWWKNNSWDNGLTYYAFYSNNDGEASSYISGNALPSQLHLGAVAPENAAFLRVSIYKDGVAANAPLYAVVAEENYFPNAYVEHGTIERYVYASDIVTEDELAQGLSIKADKDGTEPALVAGTAEQLVSTTGTTETSLYKSRANNYESNRVSVQQIIGGTVAWNQLWPDSANLNVTSLGVSVLISGTSWKITGTGTTEDTGGWISRADVVPNIIAEHVYAVILSNPIPNGGSQGMRFGFSGTGVAGIYKSTIATATANTSETTRLQVRVLNGVTWNMDSRVCIYDLTQMFGESVASAIQAMETANEGDGVALFRELFPNNYYPYNAGTLMSVCTNGRTSGGQTYPLDGTIELRGIPVMSDGKIVFDGDTYDPDGTVTRNYGIIRLRDINWTYGEASPVNSGVYRWYSKSSFSGFAVGTEKYILSTGRYKHVPSGGSVKDGDKTVLFGNALYIRDDEWGDDKDQFLASLGDAYIVYKLRSTAVTTETAAPYQKLQIAGETEEFTDAGDRDVAIPVCCKATYQTNLREGIEKVLSSIESAGLEYPYAFSTLQNDTTLTQAGAAADAKVTGDRLTVLGTQVTEAGNRLDASEDVLSQLIDLQPIQERTYYHMILGSCHVAGTSIYSPVATQKFALIQQIIPRTGGEKYYYDDSTYELAFVPLTDAGVSKGYYGWYRSSPWTDPITTTGSYLTFLIRRQDGGNFTAADDLNGLIWKVPDVATNPIVAQRELAEANAAGYTDTAVKAAVDSIGRSIPAGYVRYEFPAGFTWEENPVAGKVYTDGKGRFFVDYDVMSHVSTTGLDVYVSAAGSDSNDGLSASTPKKTLSAAIAISGARRVHIAGGHYPMQNLTISADIDLIGDPDDRPVFTGQSNLTAWTATATTGVYTTDHKNHAVFYDLTTKADGFYRAYVEANSVSAVEATAGTYYDDGTTATLHTYGSSTTPYDDVCYTAGFYAMQLTTSGHQVLVANLCFTCGGSYSSFGLSQFVGDETNRGTYLVYNCDGSYSIPATESGSSAFVPQYADVVIQNCTAYHSGNDGFSYAAGCKVVEINCASAFNGSGSITSSNGSTGHGGSIIRINGAYHDTYGPVVHDVGATESVNLGLSAWHSTCEGKPNFCASGGAVKMWLDSCVGYSSDAGIDVGKPGEPAASAVIYKRNCTSDVADGVYGGQIVRY